jgi:signal transduction histidine kinase
MKAPAAMMSALFSRLKSDDVTQVDTIPHLLPVPEHERLGAPHNLCMALRHGMNLIGVQVALSRGGRKPFTETQRRIARGISQVASRALEHERIVEKLDLSNRLKSEFVATMSHEIRTPLTVITGYVDLMLEGTFGALKAVQAEALQRVQKSSLEVLDLINATLDLGRLEAGHVPLEMQEISIASLLDEVDGETRELQEQSGLRFLWDAPRQIPRVLADAAKLKVVLKNLIGNAVKFTEAGTVTVEVHAGNGGVEVSISDTGIGIAPEALPIIFEPFRQADGSRMKRQGGVGLGLYIVRRLLDMMGGSVTVDTEVGCGSTFRVLLPASSPTGGPSVA